MSRTNSRPAGRISRRDVFRASPLACAALASLTRLPVPASAQAAPALQPLNRFPRMVQEHFVRLMHESRERRLARLSGLKDRRDAEAYVDEVRGKIRECFGLFPEKTPLNARITGTVQRSAYTIEKVIFESRPGFLVTANLYVPKGRPFPLPGVVGSCGHSVNGKASETYQGFSQGLATMGYVVLTFDPIGQGERMQYVDPSTWKPLKGTGTREHLYAGNQQFLVGEFFGSWRAWDGIRALDYLLSREEVDPRLVGITGNSGGGTMTTWLCALEERWTMAAPGCFVTEFRRNLENELPADTEQCPPKALALDLEHEDFIAVMAPKPVILLAKERDFFDARGSEAAFERLRRLYALLGAEDNIAFSLGPTPHGYSRESREAMYRWFNRVTGVSDAKTEPALVIEKDETLWCTPHGQIAELAPTPIHSFTRVRSQALRKRRLDPSGEALRRTLLRVLRIPEPGPSPEFRILRPQRNRRYPLPHAVTYMVETEPGVHAIVYRLSAEPLWSRPPRDVRRAILYVSHLSSDEELRSEPLIRELVEGDKAAALFTCDVRGIGDSRPDTCDPNSFRDAYGSDYFYAIHSVMFDRPYVGRRTLDVWTVLEWLYAGGHAEVHLAAKGWGTVPAAFAAVLSRRVPRVTLKNALTSFSEVAEAADYNWPLALLPPDVLSHFDLPDCYRELERGELRIIEPWGANPAV